MFYTFFDTALGEFALAWTDAGLRRVFLPGDYRDATVQRLEKLGAAPADPDRRTAALADRIEDYADGADVDFSDTVMDLSGVPEFHRRAYDILLTVPRGRRRRMAKWRARLVM